MAPQLTRTPDEVFESGSSLSGQPLLLEPPPVTRAIELTTFLPTNPIPPEESPHYYKRLKNRAQHWVFKPTVLVFIALIIIATMSFCPALLSTPTAATILQADEDVEDLEDGNRLRLIGDIRQFSWSDTGRVSMKWYPFSATESMAANADIYSLGQITPVFSGSPFGLDYFETDLEEDTRSSYFAPDDTHYFTSEFYAINRSTNESIPVSFEIQSTDPGDFSVKFFTTWVKWYGAGNVVQINILISRSNRARAFTYSMFAINWILTLCSMITTTAIFSRGGEVGEGVALLPITAILAIPAIRNLYPGSPQFGIHLDVVGFFPQMLTVAGCTVVVTFSLTLRSMRKRRVIEVEV